MAGPYEVSGRRSLGASTTTGSPRAAAVRSAHDTRQPSHKKSILLMGRWKVDRLLLLCSVLIFGVVWRQIYLGNYSLPASTSFILTPPAENKVVRSNVSTTPVMVVPPPPPPSPPPPKIRKGYHHEEVSKPLVEDSRESTWVSSPEMSSYCNDLFVNGFKHHLLSCEPSLKCWRNRDGRSTYCAFKNLAIDRSKITVTKGGEDISAVEGRSEQSEYCKYENGAFQVMCGDGSHVSAQVREEKASFESFMGDVMSALTIVDSIEPSCESWMNDPTFFVTRYEYANLYHTMTDWYNCYQLMRILGFERIKIVFLDGHSSGSLDQAWEKLFGETPLYVSQLPMRTCFREAYLVPAGYQSAISISVWNAGKGAVFGCKKIPHVQQFAEHFLTSFGVELDPANDGRPVILLVFRHDYQAHPRQKQKRISRKISNEQELYDAVTTAFPEAKVERCSYEEIPMQKQLEFVRRATIVVGVHGAGLTHVLFQRPGTGLIELVPGSQGGNVHFRRLASFAGIEYRTVDIPGSSNAILGHKVQTGRIVQQIRSLLQVVAKAKAFAQLDRSVPSLPPQVVALRNRKPVEARLAIIIPLRESPDLTSQGQGREQNLKDFAKHMHPFLQKAGRKHYEIIVVEQEQGYVFNKGALFNTGFQLVENDFDYFVFHDVDQVPQNTRNDYSMKALPTHMCTGSSQYGYKRLYVGMVGGAITMTKEQFRAINGYGNRFWGWGREDDDLYERIKSQYQLQALDSRTGRYEALNHKRVQGLDETKMFAHNFKIQNSKKHYDDGLTTLRYHVISITWNEEYNYTRYKVDFDFEWMPKTLDESPPYQP